MRLPQKVASGPVVVCLADWAQLIGPYEATENCDV